MSERMRRTRSATFIALVAAATAAGAQESKKADSASDKANIAAVLGGEPITLAELDAELANSNMKLAQQLYDARQAALNQIILKRAMAPKAAAAGVPVDQYIQQQIGEKATPVTDEDIEAFYNANKARLRGRTLEQLKGQIRQHLASQRQNEARDKLVAQAKKSVGLTVHLEPPRVEVAVAPDEPMQGPKDAPVTIIEYADFQ